MPSTYTLNPDYFQSVVKNQSGKREWNMYQAHEYIIFPPEVLKVKKHILITIQLIFLCLVLQSI